MTDVRNRGVSDRLDLVMALVTAVPARSAAVYSASNALTSVTAGGTATGFSYAGLGNTTRLTAGGTSYANTPLGVSGQSGTSPHQVTREPNGALVSLRTSGGSSYYLTDRLGSILALITSAGQQVAQYSYEPYGTTRTSSGTLAAVNPYRYTSGYQDSATGLYKLGARYYDTSLGRFTQPDPSGQDPHYTYAANNPSTYIDPNGEAFFIPLAIAAVRIAPLIIRGAGGRGAFNASQRTIIAQAKSARRTGLSRDAGDALAARANSAGVLPRSHGPSVTTRGQLGSHTCIGPIKHIPLC